MHKPELIQHLRNFIVSDKNDWKGQDIFAEYFALWLERLDIPSDEQYDFYDLIPHLPQLAIDAFEDFRTGTDDDSVRLRAEWERIVGSEVPNVTDVGESSVLDQGMVAQTTLSFMLKEIVGKERGADNTVWFEKDMEAYANAQRIVLNQLFDKFLRRVYRKGMFKMMDECQIRYMTGQFNGTELRTGMMAGRVMFTFARKIDPDKPGTYEKEGDLYCNEHSVSWVAEDSDPLGLSAGVQSLWADFRTSMDMIEDVINHWPADSVEQAQVFKSTEKMGFM